MSIKKSRFNFIYKRSDNEFVIYNTYSKALIVLDALEYENFFYGNNFEKTTEDILIKNHILIEDSFDEEKFLKYCHNLTKYSKEALHLVLATTMDCNFGCPYCYENRRKGKMSTEIQNSIIDFIKRNLENGIKLLDITWYGGEPLLYPDIIKNMSEKIHKLVEKYSCELNMYIVTNGYLLTPEMVKMLDSIGIIKVQITLDGLKESHDSRRHLIGGNGTFDKIYENLQLFEEYPIRVDVRMNVDNQNCKDYIGLQKKILELDNQNVVLYPSPVEDINPDTVNEISDFMTFDEFEKFAVNICKDGDNTSAKTSVLDDRYCYCQAETINNYVIDELGNCYKCWDQVGRIENSCFNIKNPNDKNYINITNFMCWDPFTDAKCKDCVFLPICFGGCKFHRMNAGKYDCGFTDESMKSYLEEAFFSD